MPKRLLKLPRKLFGYQPSSVDQLIADRDSMLSAAEQRVRAAEARIAELEEDLKRREEDLEAVKRQAPDAVPPASPQPASQPEVQAAEPEVAPSSEPPTWMSGSEVPFQPGPDPAAPQPSAPRPSAAEVEEEGDGPEEIEEWPVPTVAPRTVEFTPPSEPSADFDPMPIGGEEAIGPRMRKNVGGRTPRDPIPLFRGKSPSCGAGRNSRTLGGSSTSPRAPGGPSKGKVPWPTKQFPRLPPKILKNDRRGALSLLPNSRPFRPRSPRPT